MVRKEEETEGEPSKNKRDKGLSLSVWTDRVSGTSKVTVPNCFGTTR